LIDAAHDNLQPNDAVASPLSPGWSATFTGLVTYPAIAHGRVFVGTTDGAVTALDAQTGETLWGPRKFPSSDSRASVMVATELDRVYALTRDGLLSGLDATSGHETWSEHLKGQYFFWSAPVAAGGAVYVNGLESGGTTYAVNGATGEVSWTAGTEDGSFGTVAVTGGRVYEAEACDQLSAFESATGKLDWYVMSGCTGGGGTTPAFYNGWIWERDWANGNMIIGADEVKHGTFSSTIPPAFAGTMVFYVDAGVLSAMDIASGKPVWAFSDDPGLCGAPAVAGVRGQVFVGSSSGTVYELDAATGRRLSSANVGTYNCTLEVNALAIAGGRLYVPSGNRLVTF
jgi:outer membrane protein assembly factor BamB